MKDSFTLLELIFVLMIVIILSTLLLKTVFFKSLDKSNIAKIKSEVFLIRTAINKHYEKQVLLNKVAKYIDILDMSANNKENEYLFTGTKKDPLLNKIILSSKTGLEKDASWIKTAKNSYEVFIMDVSIVFKYNKNTGIFSCNYDEKLCKELSE